MTMPTPPLPPEVIQARKVLARARRREAAVNGIAALGCLLLTVAAYLAAGLIGMLALLGAALIMLSVALNR